ncbi:hypothetical protein [Desmospora activa]|uniref:Lipid-A-disaccharide synthetase n=1 Tax=Desmospora activa DSM 45169 TaxID=1121389 RepID=A0A2T4ZAF7_9BACL|nr:hypothetical protein [Desmospora activa]PTM58857.1 lipid-A-disaccharide synthetase [Desmospora activa DSM 45169]
MYQMHPHAWALYFDFLHEFRSLSYRGVPLGLFCYFPDYTGGMASTIELPTFRQTLRHDPDRAQIQPQFEQFLPRSDQGTMVKTENKPIVFLGGTYLHPLDPTKVLIVEADDSSCCHLPTCNLRSYQSDVSAWIKEAQSQAQNIFLRLDDHPVFSGPTFKQQLIDVDIPLILPCLDAVLNFLEQVPVACVVVEGSNATNKLSCILPTVAAMKGIPSLSLQHGIIGADRGWLPLYTTKQAAYGDFELQFFRDAGVPVNRLAIAGHPRFDAIFERTHINRTHFCAQYGMNPDKKFILIPTQPIWDLTSISDLIHHLLRYSEAEVMMKLHPTEIQHDYWKERYRSLIQQYPSIQWFTTECHLYDLMANADAAISLLSTTGLELLLMDKPVVYMGKGTGASYPYSSRLTHSDPKVAAALAHRLVVDEAFQEFARNERVDYLKKAYPVKQAKMSVFQLIEEMTGINPEAL